MTPSSRSGPGEREAELFAMLEAWKERDVAKRGMVPDPIYFDGRISALEDVISRLRQRTPTAAFVEGGAESETWEGYKGLPVEMRFVEPEIDGCYWLARFKAFPDGVMADGETREEAFHHLLNAAVDLMGALGKWEHEARVELAKLRAPEPAGLDLEAIRNNHDRAPSYDRTSDDYAAVPALIAEVERLRADLLVVDAGRADAVCEVERLRRLLAGEP